MIRKSGGKKSQNGDDNNSKSASPMKIYPASLSPESPWNDRVNMFLLLVLYTLQGIPMGLCGSIPLILKERKVSYEGRWLK
jgi:hypothetical protein